MLPPVDEKKDGRRERSVRTRKAIVSALLDLVSEGNAEPSGPEIARRAGIAVRSIGQHFASREELFLAAVEEHTRRVAPTGESIDVHMGLSERIAAFAEVRARELELCAPVRRATNALEAAGGATDPKSAMARATDHAWQRRRREVKLVFERELSAAADATKLLDALDLLTHGRTWDTMRYAMRLSRVDATSMMRRTLAAVLV